MLSIRSERQFGFLAATAAVMVVCLASPAAAQAPVDPNPGKITLTGGIDFASAYMFRGLRQDDTGSSCGRSATWASLYTKATGA